MPEKVIDLRSDTVTRPSTGMRAAMLAADVGDDVYADDPTVDALQRLLAQRTGKEAALFFPTGTQSNLAALMSHCDRGDEYIVGQYAHTYRYEGGGAAVLGSIQPQPIDNAEDGTLPLEKIAAAIKPLNFHHARTRLLTLENTIGGKVLPASYVDVATAMARQYGLATHLDGARVFNAAIASGQPVSALCKPFDSVSICFSKGLGAPVGSVLVGSSAMIDDAKRWRKMLGGGMRQSGMLAAACLYALEHHVDTLAQDHNNARRLATALSRIGHINVQSHATNMVFISIAESHRSPLSDWLTARGILTQLLYATTSTVRLVLHRDVDSDDVDRVAYAVQDYFITHG